MGEILPWRLEAVPILPAAVQCPAQSRDASPWGLVVLRGGHDLRVFPPRCPTVAFFPSFSRITWSNDFIYLQSEEIERGVWSARGGHAGTLSAGGCPAAPGACGDGGQLCMQGGLPARPRELHLNLPPSLSLSQPREKGRMRFHRLQNVQIALDFLKQRQVRTDFGSPRSGAGGSVVGSPPGGGSREGCQEAASACAGVCPSPRRRLRTAVRGLSPPP